MSEHVFELIWIERTFGNLCDHPEWHSSILLHFLKGIVVALYFISDFPKWIGGAAILQRYKVHECSLIERELVSNKRHNITHQQQHLFFEFVADLDVQLLWRDECPSCQEGLSFL